MIKNGCGRRIESEVWSYFKYDAVTNRSSCVVESDGKACGKTFTGKNPTNLKAHLQSQHAEVYTLCQKRDTALYLIELNTLPEDTNALDYWHIKQSQFHNISQLALDLISAPSSQAYVERVFSVCGDLSARKRNRAKAGMERRVFLKLNKRELAKVNA